jgi:hypothetical protein
MIEAVSPRPILHLTEAGMDDGDAGRNPSRRQALVTAGLAAVAVPLFRPRHRRTPRPTRSGTPSPDPTPAATPSPEPTPVQSGTDPASAPSYITGLVTNSGGGYFTDQDGNPRLWVASETWGLPPYAGKWTSPQGNWQSDYDNFFSARSAQGVTVTMIDPVDGPDGPNMNGTTWDGLAPFASGGDPTTGLNNTFWERIDYAITSAQSNGITIGFVFNAYDWDQGGAYASWTTGQFQAFGAAIGARYACQPNIIWLFGNDAYQGLDDTDWDYILTGLRGAGANQLVGAWWSAEYTSRYETDNNGVCAWGVTNSDFNFCYTYNAAYWVIQYAYGEAADEGAASLLAPVWGDGYFYQGASGGGYYAPQDRAMRQETWWTLAAGARGILSEAENIWQWTSAACLAAVTADWFLVNNLGNIVTRFTSLPDWHLLMPDLSSTFVTAGRGTEVSGLPSGGGGGSYEDSFANSWVAASVTPSGSLAVLYLPNATTITINQSLMQSGYTATWVDPVSGAMSQATPGSTYDSTAKGSNSQGDPDWVLVLQG